MSDHATQTEPDTMPKQEKPARPPKRQRTARAKRDRSADGPAPIILAIRGSDEYLDWLREFKDATGEDSLNELADAALVTHALAKGFKRPPARIKPKHRTE